MQVGIFSSHDELFAEAASYIMRLIDNNPEANIGFPTGTSREPLARLLCDAHARGEFSFEDARVFSLDEYVGLPKEHPQLYRNIFKQNLVGDDKTGLRETNLFTPDGSARNLVKAADDFEKTIKSYGGIDLQLLGVGTDGHLAFNEPGGSLMSRCHIDFLTPQSRRDNAIFFEGDPNKVPEKCITQGLATLMDARHVVIIALGVAKAAAVKNMVEGPMSAMWPASVLQMHTHCTVLLDEDAASELHYAEHYRIMWDARHSEPVF